MKSRSSEYDSQVSRTTSHDVGSHFRHADLLLRLVTSGALVLAVTSWPRSCGVTEADGRLGGADHHATSKRSEDKLSSRERSSRGGRNVAARLCHSASRNNISAIHRPTLDPQRTNVTYATIIGLHVFILCTFPSAGWVSGSPNERSTRSISPAHNVSVLIRSKQRHTPRLMDRNGKDLVHRR